MVSIPIAIALIFATATFIIELHRGIDDFLGRVGAICALGAIGAMLTGEFGLVNAAIAVVVSGVLVAISIGTLTVSAVRRKSTA